MPPTAKRVETRREHHGDVFVDPYEWLRDKSDPEVIAYLEAENDYADRMTAHLEPLRQGRETPYRRDHLLDALVDIGVAGTLPDGNPGDRPVVEDQHR